MIPDSKNLSEAFEVTSYPTKTYAIADGRIKGYTDGLEAMKQAIYLILSTERFHYIIYSYNYGIEIDELFGKSFEYVCSVIKQRISEALIVDDRITRVYNFSFERNKPQKSLSVKFNVDTTEGTVLAQREVSYV